LHRKIQIKRLIIFSIIDYSLVMWRGEECVLTPVYSGIGHRKIELGFHPVDLLNFHENMMSIKKTFISVGLKGRIVSFK
jgi:hypothetical protein